MASKQKGTWDISIEINGKQVKNNLSSIGKEVGVLNRDLKKLTPGTDEFIKKSAELKKARGHFKKVKTEIDGTQASLVKVKKTVKPIGSMILAAFSISAVLAFFRTIATEVAVLRQLKGTISQITELQGKQLDRVTSKVKAMADAFDSDTKKMTEATSNLSKTMGIDFKDALDLIEEGFLDGADANGDFLDKVREYPALLKEAGFSAEESIALMTQEVKQGIYSDKGVDAIKEATLRLREMTPAAETALEAIGLSSKNIQEELVSGSKTTFEIIQEVSKKMATLPPQSKIVGQAIADIFGGPGEDAGVKYLTNLHSINLSLNNAAESSNKYVEAKKLEVQSNEAINNVWVKLTGTGSALSLVYSKFKLGLANLISPLDNLTDSTRKQQTELNILIGKITRTNEKSEDRKKLITELTKKYPFYLKHIKDEKTDNNSLRTALDEVNKVYVKRIALQSLESKIKDKQKIQAKKELDTAQRKIELGKYLAIQNQKLLFGESKNLGDSLEETSKNVKGGINKQILYYSKMGSSISAQQTTYLNRYKTALEEIYQQEKGIRGSNYLLGLSEDSVNEVKNNLKAIETQLGLTIKESDAFFDSGQESAFTIGGVEPDETTTTNKDSDAEAEKEAAAEIAAKKKVAELIADFEADQELQKELLKFDKNQREEEEEILRLEMKFQKMAEDAGFETVLAAELEDARLAAIDEVREKYDEKEVAAKQKKDAALAKLDAKQKKAFLKAETDLENSKSALQASSFGLVKSFFGKKTALYKLIFGLEKAMAINQVIVDASKSLATIASSTAAANAKAIAASPLTGGLPFIAINTALGAKQALTAKINAGVQVANIAGTAIQGFYDGGNTGDKAVAHDRFGAITGVVHANEWVAPEIMTSNPKYAQTFDYLEAERKSLVKGYFNGGSTSKNTIASENFSDAEGAEETPSDYSEVLLQLTASTNRLNNLLDIGIKANVNFGYSEVQDFKELETQLDNANNYGKITS